jgi:DinB superfamily
VNPYASFLGPRDPQQTIAATPARLRELLDSAGDSRVDQSPAPGKWSIREILCHLADCEIVFAYRLRQTLAEPHHVIQPFDQDLWATNYGAYDAQSALSVFTAVRGYNVRLIASLPAEAFTKPVSHPERGTMTFETIVETMGGHDRNHLAQIEKIVN